jgi:predicted nucleotidyltransferase
MSLLHLIKKEKELRRIFGTRELKIIEKQLLGINLTQSEKNRLSRDIRKKLEVIGEISRYKDEFKLKKGAEVKDILEDVKEVIFDSKWRKDVKEIWLFGSSVSNERTFRSDIDIAVLFKDKIDKKEATEFRIHVAGRVNDKVDIQVFEVLPEKIKKSILKNHKVIWKK